MCVLTQPLHSELAALVADQGDLHKDMSRQDSASSTDSPTAAGMLQQQQWEEGAGRAGAGGARGQLQEQEQEQPDHTHANRTWSELLAELSSQRATPGEPIGVITIEDVIEELISAEIVDETDTFMDNERLVRVNAAMLSQKLPAKLRKVLTVAAAAADKRRSNKQGLGSVSSPGPGLGPGGVAHKGLSRVLGDAKSGSSSFVSFAGLAPTAAAPGGELTSPLLLQ